MVSGYTAEIWLGQVYLPEALDHQYSLHQFCRISFAFCLFGMKPFSFIRATEVHSIGCLNIYGTHVTANNNVVFSLVSDLKIVYYNIY